MYRVSYNQPPRDELVESILREIRALRNERVFKQNIHCVGLGYIIGDNHLEEIVGGWYTWNKTKLTYEQHKRIKEVLNKMWKKTGENWKERGLY